MRHAPIAARIVLVVAGVLVVTYVITGVLVGRRVGGPPPPLLIVTWMVFGGGVTALGRMMPRTAVLGAAGLLGVVALTDLAVPVFNEIGGAAAGWISASQFTWLAIAILAVSGLVGDRSAVRRPMPDTDP